jgi:hypothetical protein
MRVSDQLTSASIVARRGMVKLLLDILASVSVARTLTELLDLPSSSSVIVLEVKDDRGRRLGNPIDFFENFVALINRTLCVPPHRS